VVPSGAAVALAGTSATLAGSSIDRPVAASAPAAGACFTTASAALGDKGWGFHLSGEPAPVALLFFFLLLLLLLLLRRRVRRRPRGRGEPVLLAQPGLLTVLLPVLLPPDSPLLRARRPLLFPPLCGAGGRPGPGHRRIRSRGVHDHPLLMTTIKTTPVRRKRLKWEGRPTHRRGVREHDERPEVVMAVRHGLEVDCTPRPRSRVLWRKALVQQPRTRQRHRVGLVAHLENVELPLHEGNNPPVMEVGEN
jgi:hypothetical protein